MIYINALNLINLCVENEILTELKGNVAVCIKNKQGEEKDYWVDKDILAKELMKDEEGRKVLIDALKKKNIDFIPKDYFWCSNEVVYNS